MFDVKLLYSVERRIERFPPGTRVALQSVWQRLRHDPAVDHETIFDDFLFSNSAQRLYQDRYFLATFFVVDNRILVNRVETTLE